jgi:hypothetical protein
VAAGQLGLTGDFGFFPNYTKNKYTTTFESPTAQKICSNYSIRRWSFLFISFCIYNFFLNIREKKKFMVSTHHYQSENQDSRDEKKKRKKKVKSRLK